MKVDNYNNFFMFDMAYKLLKLPLILPVTTVSVERVFLNIKYVRSQLCIKISNQWLNDRTVTFIERNVHKK